LRPQVKKGITLTIAIMLWLGLTILNVWDQAILGAVFQDFGPDSFQHNLRYSITLAGFFIANALYFHQLFGRIEKLDVLTLLWRLFIIGMVGITLSLIVIVVNRFTADMNIYTYLQPVFFSLSIYILTIFFLSATFIFRRFILYQKTRLKIAGLNAFWIFLGISLLFLFSFGFVRPGEVLVVLSYVLFSILCLFLSANVSWTAYLNFNQKLRALGLFSLIVVVIITYGVVMIRMPAEFNPANFTYSKYSFLNFIILFSVIYSGISILVLFFNLPASSVFEARSSEIASFNKINQAIQSNLDFTDILETLLNASLLMANARHGWIEMITDDTPPKGAFRTGKGISEEDAEALKQGFDLTEKVAREGKSYLVRNLKRHRAFRTTQSKYRSLLAVPISSPNHSYGAIFIVKEITNSFEDVTVQSIQGFAEQAGGALENAQLIKNSIELERYQEQLKIAKEVQKQLLPQELPKSDRVEFVAFSETAEEVGGDYYDFAQKGPDQFKVAIGDVSGKGTTAAFYMAEVKGIFHALTQLETTVSDFILHANQAVSNCLQLGFFMTLTYLQIDLKKRQFEMIRAGHSPAYFFESGADKLHVLREGIPGLGIVRDESFANYLTGSVVMNFKPGDFLVLYTDGITEARNADKEEFGFERLGALLTENIGLSPSELAKIILDSVRAFSNNLIHDDHTVLIIHFH
jgi:serine phosphatase RsbU (regulator of sigma subunit)